MPNGAGAKRRRCQTAQVPNGAECQTARSARRRGVPDGAECQTALGALGQETMKQPARAVREPSDSGRELLRRVQDVEIAML